MTRINRRQFLDRTSRGAAGVAVGAAALSALAPARRVRGANERVVLGLIGAGGRGSGLAARFAQRDDAVFGCICDIDSGRAGARARNIGSIQHSAPRVEADLRRMLDDKSIDAVVVATPDHWHALASILACQAGKDVYVEKPASYSVWEGRKMVEAARKYERIVQVGLQNRSAPYVQAAIDYIKSGKLGSIPLVKVYNLKSGGPFHAAPDSDAPPGVDYDLWLGPAPKRPFNPRRFHGGWYYFWDYCGGDMGNDGSHQLDLARMLMGDPPHPKAVSCSGGRLNFDDGCEVPDTQICSFDYDKFVMTFELTQYPPYMAKTPNSIRVSDQFPYWPQNATRIELYGSKQLMIMGRHGGGWQAYTSDGKIEAQQPGRVPDEDHQSNFIHCIKSRSRPHADIEQGHISAVLSHLGNIAYRTGNQKLRFDGAAERFADHAAGNALIQRAPRKEYDIPEDL